MASTDLPASVRCYIGGPQSGKTDAIARCACELVREGSGDVLVLAASPQGACDLQARLSKRGLLPASALHVATVHDVALDIMDELAAKRLFKREARLLEPFEERFLFEDLRTSRIKGRRLHEVYDFLRCGLSRLDDDDPQWLITLEEEAVLGLARACLEFTGGITPCELGNLAVRTLRANEDVRTRHGATHVLVDDFTLLDRASQILVRMIARKTLVVAGDPTPANPMLDEFPFFEGLDELTAAHDNAQLVRLEARKPADVRVFELDTMTDELRTIASIGKQATGAGNDALVISPSKLWRANTRKNLIRANLPVARGERRVAVKDFRDETGCTAARQATLARLSDNPRDGVAWRSFVGFGDYVARSAGLEGVRKAASAQGLRIDDALKSLSEGKLEGLDPQDALFQPLVDAYERCRAALREQSGHALKDASNECGHATNNESEYDCGRIFVCSPQEAATKQASVVIFGGFVDGIMPPSPASRDVERARRDLRLAAGRARDALFVTSFKTCGLETAERLGVRIERIKLHDGTRIAYTLPSSLAEECASK